VKRTEVRVSRGSGRYIWLACDVVGSDTDDNTVVRYRGLDGEIVETTVQERDIRLMPAELTDDLLVGCANIVRYYLSTQLVTLDVAQFDDAAETVLHALRLHFNNPT
jgi:hypothetical protein